MGQWEVTPSNPTIAVLTVNTIYLLLGLYGWEYIHSLGVEYAVIRGRISFRWTLVPYIVGRMSLLAFFVIGAVGTGTFPALILCLPNISLMTLSGGIALGCSSTIFMIRTWMIWKDSRLVCVLLLLLSLGQWSLLLLDAVMVKSVNVDGNCAVYLENSQIPAAALIYSTCYDFLVLALSVVGLSTQRSESPLKKHLLAQGILYFAATSIAYIPAMVFTLLNSSLVIIFTNVAITASTIASSRAVRSLLFLDTSKTSRTQENIALTTQIVICPSITREDTTPGGRPCVDEADKC